MSIEREPQLLGVNNENNFNYKRALNAAAFFEKDIEIDDVPERRVVDWEILASMMNLTIPLRERVMKYKIFLSDDGGGRLPTLFFRYYFGIKRKEIDKKAPSLITYFVSPHRPDLVDAFVEEISKLSGKVLVITELIRNGTGTRVFGDALKKYGVDFDVASVSSVKPGVPEQLEIEYGNRVFVGERNLKWGAGEVFHKQPFNAVGSEMIENTPHLRRRKDFDSSIVNIARMNISTLAGEIANLTR